MRGSIRSAHAVPVLRTLYADANVVRKMHFLYARGAQRSQEHEHEHEHEHEGSDSGAKEEGHVRLGAAGSSA
ncbi:hypothetical protein Afe04nite_52480 [Asanoa ferruginea]|nr:hypothetical protein Afe04nite_52480 [Asanoa ferruginea]